MITIWSLDAAERWATLLAHFAIVKGTTETIETNIDNRNTMLIPTTHTVWLTWATIPKRRERR